MKHLIFLLISLFTANALSAQYVYTIKADSVKITNNCDTAELILENHTQNVPGFLYNKGRGRTEFRRVVKLNDSTIVFGGDTVTIQGASADNIYKSDGTLTDNRTLSGNDKLLLFSQLGGFGVFTPYPGNPNIFTSLTFSAGGSDLTTWIDGAISTTFSMRDYGHIYMAGHDSSGGGSIGITNVGNFNSFGTSYISNGFHITADGFTFKSKGVADTLRLAFDTLGAFKLGIDLNAPGFKINPDYTILDTVYNNNATEDSVLSTNTSGTFKLIHKSKIAGSISRAAISDVNYSAGASDYLIAFVSLSTGRTVTLPAASTMTNKTLIIKDESGSAGTHNITIDGFGSETIDGTTTKVINSNYGWITLYSNGSDWFAISQ